MYSIACQVKILSRNILVLSDHLKRSWPTSAASIYLAYHHPLAENGSDYDGTTRIVFDAFLKGTLKKLATNPQQLQSFIADYIDDLGAFVEAFQKLVADTATDIKLYKLFIILGLSAKLYPLTIRLYQRNLLAKIALGSNVSLLHSIEVCDVRVYKTRGTDPSKDIGNISHGSKAASEQEISTALRNFTQGFMPDGTFQTYLSQDMYHNGALLLFLIKNDEAVLGHPYAHASLVLLVTKQITREHIMAQTPNWGVNDQGFTDETDFKNHLHMFGNLTLLTKDENSSFSNAPTHTKMTDPNMYAASQFAETKQLVHQYRMHNNDFSKQHLLTRTATLSKFVLSEWGIW